jgi:hypothetical protein
VSWYSVENGGLVPCTRNGTLLDFAQAFFGVLYFDQPVPNSWDRRNEMAHTVLSPRKTPFCVYHLPPPLRWHAILEEEGAWDGWTYEPMFITQCQSDMLYCSIFYFLFAKLNWSLYSSHIAFDICPLVVLDLWECFLPYFWTKCFLSVITLSPTLLLTL